MSGITGIFRRDGRDVDPADIKKMNDKIAHRGPDGSRVWCEGPVAFGHQMLHTTQESLHEILPFEDKESGLVITADARIDNRKDLAPQLGIEDNEYVSDSYFILKAYEKWGEKCPEELLGDFAFAIWDKNKEQLFCVRDHMGVKPFYYYLTNEMIVFSTKLNAIFELRNIPKILNKIKFAFYFLKVMEDKKFTFYDGINRLQAANKITLDNDKTKFNQYWALDKESSIIMDSEQDYFEEFKRIFSQAVHCRLRGVYNVGFELSGGLDSSSIVCMARKNFQKLDNENKIFTFSHIFPNTPQSDESYYIQKVVDLEGIEPYYVASDGVNPLENIEEILYFKDQPFNSPHESMTWNLYKKMHKNRIRIMLSGEGGDDVISHGKYFYRELFLNFNWCKLFRDINESSKHQKVSQIKLLKNKLLPDILPDKLIDIYHYFKGIQKHPNFSLFDESLLSQYPIEELYLKIHGDKLKNGKTPKKYHYYLLNDISYQNIFEMIDHSVSSFGIEPRFPYLDKRLVEYCYAVPTEIKYNNGWSRYLLRKSMEDILPKEIAWRPQKGRLGSVFRNNFYKTEHILKQILKGENKVIPNYLNLNSYRRISEKYPKKISNANYLDLWLLVCFYLWIKKKKNRLS